jgi:type II secretory pathway pseudopilin PulG
MNLNMTNHASRRLQAAHSLPEAVIAVLIVGTMLVSLYAGFTSGFAVVQLARENLRATQITLQHMESVRLYTWRQLLDTNNYLKPTFIEYFDPAGQTNQGGGVIYSGKASVSVPRNLPVEAVYSNDLRLVTVSVYWTNYSGNTEIVRRRELQTLVARHGIQNYLLGR